VLQPSAFDGELELVDPGGLLLDVTGLPDDVIIGTGGGA
jgi:hypothetical protein